MYALFSLWSDVGHSVVCPIPPLLFEIESYNMCLSRKWNKPSLEDLVPNVPKSLFYLLVHFKFLFELSYQYMDLIDLYCLWGLVSVRSGDAKCHHAYENANVGDLVCLLGYRNSV